jgi:DNA-binding transcriptional ArsR family regulator
MPDLTRVAVLLADRTRARILEELLGGTPLPAGALAARVGVAPSTVSGHLAKLEAGGLIAVEARGRRREARLAGAHVAEALEALGRLDDGDAAPVGLRAVNRRQGLRQARSCYDHMAGRVAVALADALIARGVLIADDGMFSVVPGGEDPVWAQLGVDPGALPERAAPARARLLRLDRTPAARRRSPGCGAAAEHARTRLGAQAKRRPGSDRDPDRCARACRTGRTDR